MPTRRRAAHRAYNKEGFFEDYGRSLLIGVGEGGTLHLGEAQMVEFAALPVDTEHYVPETLGAPLAEEHGRQVRPIGELALSGPCQAWLSTR